MNVDLKNPAHPPSMAVPLGLREAIGPGGLTYPNGDSAALAQRLKVALTDDQATARCREAAPSHLALNRRVQVATNYLAVFEHVLRGVTDVRAV